MVVVMRASLPVLLHLEGGCNVQQIAGLVGTYPGAVRDWLAADGCAEQGTPRTWRAPSEKLEEVRRLRALGLSLVAACQRAGLATVH